MTEQPLILEWVGGEKVIRPMTAEEIAAMRPALTVDDYRKAIDAHVEETARSRQYNSAAHMASYVASTVPQWADEAQRFVAWRDQVWLAAIQMMTDLTEAPEIASVINRLPKVDWGK